jgi:hypothetical protein
MKLQNTLKENSPTILLVLGLGGFFGAMFYTAKVAPKAHNILSELPPEASKLDQGRAIASIYAPVAGLMLASTGAILASNRIMKNRYAALLVLYSFTDQMVERWKASALEEVGAKKFKNIKDRVAASDEPIPQDILDEQAATILYDRYSGRWFTTNSVEVVRKAINDVNDTMYQENFAPLNDFYYALKMDSVEYGNEVGWHIDDGPNSISLIPIKEKDEAYLSIEFNVKPRKYK